MEEIWKEIEGYEGLYEVSNLGRVRSLGRFVDNNGGKEWRKGRILKLHKCGRDKKRRDIRLSKDGNHFAIQVSVLVAKSFIPIPEHLKHLIGQYWPNGRPKLEVNHIDENPTNNCVDNLEWCDGKYNANFGTRNERVVKTMFENYIKLHPEYEGMTRDEIIKFKAHNRYLERRDDILKSMKEKYVHKSDKHNMTVTHWKLVDGKRVWY